MFLDTSNDVTDIFQSVTRFFKNTIIWVSYALGCILFEIFPTGHQTNYLFMETGNIDQFFKIDFLSKRVCLFQDALPQHYKKNSAFTAIVFYLDDADIWDG